MERTTSQPVRPSPRADLPDAIALSARGVMKSFEIGPRRLRAMPRTTFCLHCQRSAERAAAPS